MLDPQCANEQSHTVAVRLKDNRGQNLAESEETKDLTQPQKERKATPSQ